VTLAHLFIGVALGGALLLLAGGVVHVRERRWFATVLAAQRLLPRRLHAVVAHVMGPVELVVGAATVVGWLASPALATVAFPVCAACYVAFGGYLTVLRVRRPSASCGCLGGRSPVTWLVVLRAWVFAAASAGVGFWPSTVDGLALPSALAVLVAGVAWLAPELLIVFE
jgi:hypothetical protein